MTDQIEDNFIICAPVEGVDDHWAIPGGEIRMCSKCYRAVHLAPSGVKIVAEKDLFILCMNCGMRKARESQEHKEIEITDEVIEELRTYAPNVLEALIKLLRTHRDKIKIREED